MFRFTLAAAVLVSSLAFAQPKISGTLVGSFDGLQMGSPRVRAEITLACGLMCPPAMPLLSYRMRAGIGTYFNSSAMESTGFTAYPTNEIESDGQTVILTGDVRPGTVSVLIARGVTCECGNNLNEGGQVDLYSQPFVTPPNLVVNDSRVGSDVIAYVTGEPKGAEHVDVSFTGAGIDTTVTLYEADFTARGATIARKATFPGMITVTASLNGVPTVRTANVTANTVVDAGRPTGGGGGDGPSQVGMCSTTALPGLVFLALVLARRRPRGLWFNGR
ncbi:MAG: hypothetical protein JNM17_33280 [Archangium sp.]|nr:hypothetical protein [Archangium sp.]